MHCLSHRKSCIKPSSYSISLAEPPPQPATHPPGDIICVAPKRKGGCHQIKNVFADDRGYPDQINDHNILLHNINISTVLRKLRHPPPAINEVDPSFDFPFDEALHGARLRQKLDLSHLNDALQTRIYTLIQKYWSEFDERKVWVPVKITSVSLTPATHLPSPSRISDIALKNSLSCERQSLASNRLATSVRSTMGAGYSSASWLLNLIKNMFVTSTNSSDASV